MDHNADDLASPSLPPAAGDLPPAPSSLHRLFFGPFGLRAGWSLLIYLAILATLIGGLSYLAHEIKAAQDRAAAAVHSQAARPTPGAVHLGTPQSAAQPATRPAAPPAAKEHKPTPLLPMILSEYIVFSIFFLLSWLMAAIERRSVGVFGLGDRRFLGRFLVGSLWGFLAMSLLIAALRLGHFLTFDALLDHGPSIVGWGLLQLLAFLSVGFLEEYMFRGYLQFTLTRGMVWLGHRIAPRHARSIAFWIASFLTSALFLYAHTRNAGETWFGLLVVFLAGVVLVLALWRTGSLWWAIGFHMAWDWSQSFLYGVPDSGGLMQGRLFATHPLGNPLYSGGTVGPEGSLLCVPILLLVILVLLRFTPSSPQPPLEPRTRRPSPEPLPETYPAAPFETPGNQLA